MKFTKLKAAGIAAGVAVFAFMGSSATAVGSTSFADGDGVDYDASCVLGTSVNPPATGNSVPSPGASSCTVSTYDGSVEGLDLNDATAAVTLGSNAAGQLVAEFNVDGTVPAAGSTVKASYDLPDNNFVGGNYFALFQNKTIQTLAKYTACPQIPPRPTPIVNRFATWKDGAHFFLAFSAGWDGTRWVHSVQLGEYFPGPDGGFSFFELGTNNGGGWVQANVYHPYAAAAGTAGSFSVDTSTAGLIKVAAPGVYQSPDTTNCNNGHFDYWLAKPGDVIANVKALTTANQVVTLPQTIPLSITCGLTGGAVCESDLTTVGGFVFYVDTTDGNSTAGLLNSNTPGVAYSGGAIGITDTLGDGPTCPTPTFGGLLPENPLWTVDTACQIDDDPVSRGSFLQEWWDTTHGFVF